ncbi:MAG: AMP-binding protein [Myxococcales bacterium]|nr:AMP-binding protein [Myxococcales bacterium]
MITIPDPLRSAAIARPDHPALVVDGLTLGYAALAARAAAAAAHLTAAGLAPGDRVARAVDPGPDAVIPLFALAAVGAIACPLDPRATPAEQAAALAAFQPHHALADRPLGLPALPLVTDGPPHPERFWPLDEPRALILTSGTTAAPRAVPLTGAQMVFSAYGSAIRLGHDPADRWLCCLPLHHVGGLSILVRSALHATTVELHPRFEPAAVAAALDDGRVTLASLTPAMLAAVLDARPERPFPARLRALLIGGARTPPELQARARALGAPLATTWGMTEAASQIATRAPGDHTPGAPPLAFARVTAAPDGALTVTGPLVAAPLVTADRGHVDATGRVHVLGRRDDIIQSGGKKLAPAEIEDVLRAHPAIADAAVIALQDPTWGERPAAVLVAAGPDRPAPAELRAWCRARLSPYKAPDRYAWVDALPRDPLGKLRRRALAGLRFEDQGQEND